MRRAFFSAAMTSKKAVGVGGFERLENGLVLLAALGEPCAGGLAPVVELGTDMREVAADNVTDALRARGLRGPQRRHHARDVVGFGRVGLLAHPIGDAAREERDDLERPALGEEILEQHHLQFDRVLGNVGQRIIEEAIAIMLHDSVHVVLVGLDQAKRRIEVLAREREAVGRVMRRGDDDEDARVRLLDRVRESRGHR